MMRDPSMIGGRVDLVDTRNKLWKMTNLESVVERSTVKVTIDEFFICGAGERCRHAGVSGLSGWQKSELAGSVDDTDT